MKTVKQYPNLCKSCNGSGLINNYEEQNFYTPLVMTKITCPVCSGTGVITVTETIEDDRLIVIKQNDP